MNTRQKKVLYESIMKNVSKLVKRTLNEDIYPGELMYELDILPDEWIEEDIFNIIISDTRYALILYKFYNDRGKDMPDYDNMPEIYIELAHVIIDSLHIKMKPLDVLNGLDNAIKLQYMLNGYINGK